IDDALPNAEGGKVQTPTGLCGPPAQAKAVSDSTAAQLREEVTAMNVNNFIVRPNRQLVEKYQSPERWATLTPEERAELADRLADLPSTLETDGEEAKRFDLLLLRLQLALLNTEPAFERLRDQVRQIAGLLE